VHVIRAIEKVVCTYSEKSWLIWVGSKHAQHGAVMARYLPVWRQSDDEAVVGAALFFSRNDAIQDSHVGG